MNTSKIKVNASILWASHLFSALGERLSYVALIILAGEILGNQTGTTVVLLLYTLTFVISAPASGFIIDEYNKKTTLLLSDYARAFLVLGYCFFVGKEELISGVGLSLIIFTVVFIISIARSGFWAIIPEVVPENDIAPLNAKLSLNNEVAMALGTAIGGWMILRMSYESIFVINSGTYLISAVILLFLTLQKKKVSKAVIRERVSLKAFITNELLNHPVLLSALIFAAGTSLLAGAMNSYMITSMEMKFNLPVSYKGYVYAIWSFGGLMVALGIHVFKKRLSSLENMNAVMLLSVLGSVLIMIGFFLNSPVIFLGFIFLIGLTYSLFSVIVNTLCMKICPAERRGKFAATFSMVVRLSMVLGILIAPLLDLNFYFHPMLILLVVAIFLVGFLKLRKSVLQSVVAELKV
jgi:MFS transporter, DHA3 family, macrolide efflux protein